MSDIFGKTPLDYPQYRDLHSVGELEDALKGFGHNFDALGRGGTSVQEYNIRQTDASPFGYISDNLDAISSQIEEIRYTEDRLAEVTPVVTNVPVGAETASFVIADGVGEAGFVDSRGTNVQSARTSLRRVAYGMARAGIEADWSYDEIQGAQFAGIPLETMTVNHATRACMEHMQKIAISGDDSRNIKGLVNQTTGTNLETGQIPRSDLDGTAGLTSATLNGADANTVNTVRALQKEVVSLVTASSEVFGRSIRNGLTLFAPLQFVSYVMDTGYGDNKDKSIWDFFVTHNLWYTMTSELITLRGLNELRGMGADTNSDRLVLTVMNPDIYQMTISQQITPLTVQDNGWFVTVPLTYRVSGLNVLRPIAVRYLDIGQVS